MREEVRKEIREEVRKEVQEGVRKEIQEEVRTEVMREKIQKKLEKSSAFEKIAEELEVPLSEIIRISGIKA